MTDWWNHLSPVLHFYWFLAIPSSVLFIIQTAMTLLGLGEFHSLNSDFTHNHLDLNHINTNPNHSLDNFITSFKFLTLRNIIIFFTVFSWCGIVLTNQDFTLLLSLLLSLICGILLMLAISSLYYIFSRMTEEGTMNLNNAINMLGEVYLTIPAGRSEKGKVMVTVQGSLRELDAVTDGEEIVTGEKIIVTGIVDNQHLLVEKYNQIGGIIKWDQS